MSSLRTGLRNDDVQALVRALREATFNDGLGPEEAWARAKATIIGVEPGVLDGWRDTIFKKVEEGTAHSPVQVPDVFTRVAMLDEDNAKLRRQLAEAGAKYESLVTEAKAKLAEKNAEIERLTEQLTTPKKK